MTVDDPTSGGTGSESGEKHVVSVHTPDQVVLWDRGHSTPRWKRPSGPHLRHVRLLSDDRYLVCTGGDGVPVLIDGWSRFVGRFGAGNDRFGLAVRGFFANGGGQFIYQFGVCGQNAVRGGVRLASERKRPQSAVVVGA